MPELASSTSASHFIINSIDVSTMPTRDNNLVGLLLKRQAELNALLEITNAINANSPASDLFSMLRMICEMHLNIGRMRLIVKEGSEFFCAVKYGGETESADELREIFYSIEHLKGTHQINSEGDNLLAGYQFFIPVVHKKDILAFALVGDFLVDLDLLENDLNFIQTLINVTVVALENKKLFEAWMHRELLQRDIKIATEVQNMLLPLKVPETKDVEVGSIYLPNQNIGGDYFDFIRLSDHEFIWCIADVSGKSVAAALLMATVQATIRAAVFFGCDLITTLERLNSVIEMNTNGERFITLFLAKYDQRTRQLQYINAGHQAPVLLMGEETILLKNGSTILGAFKELPFINVQSIFLKGQCLVFNYTDGLIESADEDVLVPEEELVDCIKTNRSLTVKELNSKVLSDIRSKYNVKMDSDDITMLSIKIAEEEY